MDTSSEKGIFTMGTVLTELGLLAIFIVIIWKVVIPLQKSTAKLDNMAIQFENIEYSAYDNAEVAGSEVMSAVNTKANSNVTVKVITKSSTHDYNGEIYNIKQVTNADYIEPTAKFDAQIDRTANNTITGITFTQK